MLRTLFSLDGSLDRRRYLLWTVVSVVLPVLAVAVTSVAALLIIRAELLEHLRPVAAPLHLFARLWPILVLAAFLWTTLALTAKRLRDIGLPPVPIILGVGSAGVAAKIFGVQPVGPVLAGLLAAIWSYGVPMFLALWPGRARKAEADIAETFA